MGDIEPVDPFEPLETDEVREANARFRAGAAPQERPDWLVGADAGVEAERERMDRESAAPVERPALLRPESEPEPQAPRRRDAEPVALRLPSPDARMAASKGAEKAPDKPVAWAAAASSLPTLRVLKGGAPEAPASPDARFAPDLKLAARAPAAPPVAVDPAADDELAFPDDAGPSLAPAIPTVAATPRGPRTARPREAWWLIAVDTLRSDLKVQILVGLVVVLAAVVAFWPRAEKSTSLASIRHDPHLWDGRVVRVTGRVGEVFPVGGGYAFYLHQGRDTLVVFTRSRTPRTRDRLAVKGSISTGWLDGRPRQALFENAAP